MPKVKAIISLILDKYVFPTIPIYGPELEQVYHKIGHENKLGGHEISRKSEDPELLHVEVRLFYSKVILNLEACFPDESLYKSFNTIFNPKAYLTDRRQLLQYGMDEVSELAEHFLL